MIKSDIEITIVAFDNGSAASVAGPAETITLGAQLLGAPLPTIHIVTCDDNPAQCVGGISLTPTRKHQEINKTDVLILGSIGIPTQWLNQDHTEFTHWLNSVSVTADTIIAICSGSFVLAKSGLLNQKKATTHWYYSDIFRDYFPDIPRVSNTKIVQCENTYTTSDVPEYTNVMLCLIEHLYGKKAKEICSSFCHGELEIAKESGLLTFTQFRQHSDPLIHTIQDQLHQDPSKKWTLKELSLQGYLSERQLNRRFCDATSCTPIQYVQKIRLTIAKEKLEKSRASISEIASEVGYEDLRYFRDLFKKHTHMTPNEYRKKYHSH